VPIQYPNDTVADGTRVVVPFAIVGKAQPWPLSAVRLALEQDGWKPEYHHMVHDESYWELLEGLWKTKETFIIVEHDIVVWPGALTELINCPHLWCTFPYYSSVGWIEDGLGCTKFSGKFTRLEPKFLYNPYPECCQHTRHYCGLDRTIAHKMESIRFKPHVHHPGVINLNERWT
jgi:hypothetical protein